MSLRPFKLPQDIDLMIYLVLEGFQYPENPDWSVQEDEIQGMVDRINGAKRLWPIIQIMRFFIPVFRDILCGFIDEEDGKPAGLINYMRQRNTPEWYIANVTVLPAYRRRGIARKLVEATISELHNRKAQIAFLDVVVGNDPAFNLYREIGFQEFTQSYEYYLHKDTPISAATLPEGYNLTSISPYNWRTRFVFAQRVTPAHITSYEPVTEARFRISKVMTFLGKLLESVGGAHTERFAIYGPNGEVAGIGQFTCRTRAGGTNLAQASIDPSHPELAGFILGYVFSAIQKASPGHRTEIGFEDWELALIQCAEEMGCEKRFGMHRMALRF